MKTIFLVAIFLFSISICIAGTPGLTLNHSISSLNSPIIVGQQVYFNSTIVNNTCGQVDVLIHFGPYATPPSFNYSFEDNTGSMMAGPVTFNMPRTFDVSQNISPIGACTVMPTRTIVERITAQLDGAIPTISQWGLIIVGFFLMIFGVVSLKRRSTERFKLS